MENSRLHPQGKQRPHLQQGMLGCDGRLVETGFADPDDVAALLRLATACRSPGYGYGSPCPFGIRDLWLGGGLREVGLHALASRRAGSTTVDADLESLFKIRHRIHSLVCDAFDTGPLFFECCHLITRVCLGASPYWWCHPPHVDTARQSSTHAAILFLNDDYNGGALAFIKRLRDNAIAGNATKDFIAQWREAKIFLPQACERVVEPCAGRLVAFPVAGDVHGVTALQPPATRRHLAIWFTTDATQAKPLEQAKSPAELRSSLQSQR